MRSYFIFRCVDICELMSIVNCIVAGIYDVAVFNKGEDNQEII